MSADPSDMSRVNPPAGFTWSTAQRLQLDVALQPLSGHDVDPEGAYVHLLDTADRIVARGRVTGRRARISATLPAHTAGLRLFLPLTGNIVALTGEEGSVVDMPAGYMGYPPDLRLQFDHTLVETADRPAPARRIASQFGIVNSSFETEETLEVAASYDTPIDDTRNWYGSAVQKNGWEPRILAGKLRMGHPTLGEYSFVFQDLDVEPGSIIRFGAYIRQPSGNDGLRADLVIMAYDLTGTPIPVGVRAIEGEDQDYKDWTYESVTAAIPDVTTRIRLAVVAYPNTKQFWLDDTVSSAEAMADGDGDGVEDQVDDYPDDATRASRVWVPYAGTVTHAFEDMWPEVGDYDFNDVVIAHHVEYAYDADDRLTRADYELTLQALGAELRNGLGLRFLSYNADTGRYEDLPSQSVLSVSGDVTSLDDQVLNGVIVGNDIVDLLPSYYQNNGEGPSADPHTLRFTVFFDPAAPQPTGVLEGEFFLFRSWQRGLEIHRPGLPPTAAADVELLGTIDDRTELATGQTYQTADGLPWGLEVVTGDGTWSHPLEKTSVLRAYPSFDEWASSGGLVQPTWYEAPAAKWIYQ